MGVDANVENVYIDATVSDEAAAVERSKKFEVVERYYKRNIWTKSQVSEAVGVWITEDEFYDIVGEKYVVPEKVPTDTAALLHPYKIHRQENDTNAVLFHRLLRRLPS